MMFKTKKSTKSALLLSAISLLLCCSMLVGTTFAWFTDEVTSSNNVIQSGSLDAELMYSDDQTNWSDASQGAIFDYKLWEPGYTQVKYVKIANVGNLAFKYQLNIIPNELPVVGQPNLADVIDVYMFAEGEDITRETIAAATPVGTLTDLMAVGADSGYLLPAQGSDDHETGVETPRGEIVYGIVLKMQETAGNEYQNLSVGNGFSVQLLATQYTWENDSFNNMYDEMLPQAGLDNADQYENTIINWGSFGSWSPTYPNDQTLEAVYVFTAPHDANTVQNSKYKNWECDFVVSLDRTVTMTNGVGDLFLGGNYGNFGWVGFENPQEFVANEEIYLLGSVTTNPWTYEMVASNVGTFICGVARTYGSDMSKLNGATFTVKLRLTNPATGEIFDVTTVKHTFSDKVSTADELKNALESGTSNVTLAADIELDDVKITVPAGAETILNMNGHTISGDFSGTGNQEMFLVKGDLTVKNGVIEMAATNNQGWSAMTAIFDVTAGGVLNIENAVIENLGGSDMGFAVHLNNWGEVTLNAKNTTFKSNYVAIRAFNSGYDMNNVTLEHCHVEGTSAALWVHNYTEADFGSAAKADSQKALLNFDFTGNTFVGNPGKAGPIRLGMTNAIYGGEEILP